MVIGPAPANALEDCPVLQLHHHYAEPSSMSVPKKVIINNLSDEVNSSEDLVVRVLGQQFVEGSGGKLKALNATDGAHHFMGAPGITGNNWMIVHSLQFSKFDNVWQFTPFADGQIRSKFSDYSRCFPEILKYEINHGLERVDLVSPIQHISGVLHRMKVAIISDQRREDWHGRNNSSISGYFGSIGGRSSDVQRNFHVSGLLNGSVSRVYRQVASGLPQLVGKESQHGGNEYKQAGQYRNRISPIGRFCISLFIVCLGFCLQFTGYNHICDGRNIVGIGFFLFGFIMGFIGPFSLTGDWWNRLLNFL